MAEKLTVQQELAVHNRGGNLLVSAAAGSGKTKVLVDRLLEYILDPVDPANIDEFLVITFTQAAAAELRMKIAARLSQAILDFPDNLHLQRQMQLLHTAKISTVHGFCADLLREYAYKLDLSADFRTLDDSEAAQLKESVLQKVLDAAYVTLENNRDLAQFIDFQGFGRDDRRVEGIVLQVYENARCHLNPDGWLNWCIGGIDEQVTDVSQTVWGKYLINDLHQVLDSHKNVYLSFADEMKDIQQLSTQSALLYDTAEQIDRLLRCITWDEIYNQPPIAYGTFNAKKYAQYSEAVEKAAAFRKLSKAYLEKKLSVFSAPSEVVLHELSESNRAGRGLVEIVRAFTKEYDAAKHRRRVLDFGDLEHKTLDLLYGKCRDVPTQFAYEVGARFREVLVDEYQDTNEVQDAIYSALTAKKNNCFMVGDVKQSIYQFRLANPQIFIDKYNAFAPAEEAKPGEDRKILLSNNFRSSGNVISGVNDVFINCMSPTVGGILYGQDEMLREGIPHIPLGQPEVSLFCVDVESDTYEEEAEFVADKIHELLAEEHYIRDGDSLRRIRPEDIAILLRSPKNAGKYFQIALQKRGIACDAGMADNVFAAEESLTLISLLKVLDNPLQDIPLSALLTSKLFCFTADDMAQICCSKKEKYIYDKLKNSGIKKAEEAVKVIEKLRRDARLYDLPQLMEIIFSYTHIDSIYAAAADGAFSNSHLQTLFRLANEFDAVGGKDLHRFVDYLQSVSDSKKLDEEFGTPNAVMITSIHKSKGLEYPVVFLSTLSKRFNMRSTLAPVLCDKSLGVGLYCVDTQTRFRTDSVAKKAIALKMRKDSISEELRVLYVAMTRARDRLIMTYALGGLASRINSLVLEMDAADSDYVSQNVHCAGDWVLMTALKRTESGELFQLGSKPANTQVSDIPWDVHVVKGNSGNICTAAIAKDSQNREDYDKNKLSEYLNYLYPYNTATKLPSKLTATQMKGRVKDIEAADGASMKVAAGKHFRKADMKSRVNGGTDKGVAYHRALQYMDLKKCAARIGIMQEIERLVDAKLLTREQADMIDTAKLHRFFASELGRKLIYSRNVIREFKFSVLVDAEQYYDGVKNEKILLQGVVDCALIEDDGITVIDFKTDNVTSDTIQQRIYAYTPQVCTYVNALQRIYGLPIKDSYLYFLACDEWAKI